MHVVIIGNGISGITAARFIRKLSNHRITVISSESEYFFARTALMYVYMGHMRFEDIRPYESWFWKKNRIELIRDHVTQIETTQKMLLLDKHGSMSYDKLIIATGSITATYDWPGQELKGVQGLYSYQDLQSMEKASQGLKHAVIVGGGLIGIEMAEMFRSRGIEVTMLVREKSYSDNFLPFHESQMVNHEIQEHGVDLKLDTELDQIEGDQSGKVVAVVTKHGERIACGFVGLTTGVKPNIELLRNTPIECGKGVLVDEYLYTNVADIYAIGDCAEVRLPQFNRKPIEPVWYSGRIMGETVAYNVCGHHVPYEPGIWFNSAKFFGIEWQVYGNIGIEDEEGVESLYWEHQDRKRSIRINFLKSTQAVIGFNLMGIRFRQEVCEKWIGSQTQIREVLEQLSLANFDAEFSDACEQKLIDAYNQKFGANLRVKSKRNADQVLRFLRI